MRNERENGEPVLRALYRDGHDTMLLTMPAGTDECHAALLVNDATGAARRLSAAEAKARLTTMQLSGATQGRCGKPVMKRP